MAYGVIDDERYENSVGRKKSSGPTYVVASHGFVVVEGV